MWEIEYEVSEPKAAQSIMLLCPVVWLTTELLLKSILYVKKLHASCCESSIDMESL